MAKIGATVGKITNKDGESYDPAKRSAGTGNSFKLVEPGFYVAVVKTLKFSTYRAKFQQLKSKAADGLWTYWKFTPDFLLVNDNGTVINRQDIQVGVVEDGALVRPDGDKSKSAIWTGAQYFLGALGLLKTDDNGEFSFEFDPDLVSDRILKVKVGIGGYIKGEGSYTPEQMSAMLMEVNDNLEYEFADVHDLIEQYNIDNGYEEGEGLKPKNFITNFFPLNYKQVGEVLVADPETVTGNTLFVDPVTKGVFLSEASFDSYNQLCAASDTYTEPEF